MTTLIIGDDFVTTATLTHNEPAEVYDLTNATDVQLAITSEDSSTLYCGPVSSAIGDENADWVNGVVAVDFPQSETLKIRNFIKAFGFARLEIQATVDSRKFTWSAKIQVRNGVIN